MKTLVTLLATTAVVYNVNAQSVSEGQKLISYERFETAQKVLSPIKDKDAEANYYYGLAQLGLGDVNGAKATFSKHADDFKNQTGLARVYFKEGKSAEAMSLLNDVVGKAKKKDWERFKFAADAITYTAQKSQIQQAIDWYKTAKDRKSGDADMLISLADAQLLLNTGASNGEADQNLDEAIKIGTHNSLAYARKGLLWLQAKNYTEALTAYNQAKDADVNNPLSFRDLANVYYFNGKYDLAKQNIEQYLKLSDKSVEDQLKYGNILYLSKNYTEAEAKYGELIANGLGEKTPSLYRGLAYAQFEQGKYQDALNNLNKYMSIEKDKSAITAEDDMYFAKIYTGLASQEPANANAHLEAAENYYEKAIKADTSADKADLYRSVAENFKTAKNWGKASKWYGKIIADNPNAAPLDYFYTGYYAYYAKEYAAATKAFKGFETKYPNEPLAYLWQGKVLAAQDSEAKTGIAADMLKKWINLPLEEGKTRTNDDLIFAYQYLAVYYYNKGEKANAVTYADKILSIEPGNAAAKQIKAFFK